MKNCIVGMLLTCPIEHQPIVMASYTGVYGILNIFCLFTRQQKRLEAQQTLREECNELFFFFNHRILEALLRATKQSLDLYKRHLFFSRSVDKDHTLKYGILQVCVLTPTLANRVFCDLNHALIQSSFHSFVIHCIIFNSVRKLCISCLLKYP